MRNVSTCNWIYTYWSQTRELLPSLLQSLLLVSPTIIAYLLSRCFCFDLNLTSLCAGFQFWGIRSLQFRFTSVYLHQSPTMPSLFGGPMTTFEDSEKESEYGYVRKVFSFSLDLQLFFDFEIYFILFDRMGTGYNWIGLTSLPWAIHSALVFLFVLSFSLDCSLCRSF